MKRYLCGPTRHSSHQKPASWPDCLQATCQNASQLRILIRTWLYYNKIHAVLTLQIMRKCMQLTWSCSQIPCGLKRTPLEENTNSKWTAARRSRIQRQKQNATITDFHLYNSTKAKKTSTRQGTKKL